MRLDLSKTDQVNEFLIKNKHYFFYLMIDTNTFKHLQLNMFVLLLFSLHFSQ